MEALRAKPVPGRPPRLTGPQLQWLYRAVTEKDPRQFQFEFALWTIGMIRVLIRGEGNMNGPAAAVAPPLVPVTAT